MNKIYIILKAHISKSQHCLLLFSNQTFASVHFTKHGFMTEKTKPPNPVESQCQELKQQELCSQGTRPRASGQGNGRSFISTWNSMYQRLPSTAGGLSVLHSRSRLTTLPLNSYFVSIYSSK